MTESRAGAASRAGADSGVGAEAPGPDVALGTEIGPLTVPIDRARLVRYAGASGDFNPIHWNRRVATEAGLDDVIAHGMLTMALAGRLVTDWVGDPGAILDYQVRFTRPVVVPDPGETELVVAGTVAAVDPVAGTARVDLTATVGGAKVLGKARAVVRLPAAPGSDGN